METILACAAIFVAAFCGPLLYGWIERRRGDAAYLRRSKQGLRTPPPEIVENGWTCKDCGDPCYAFGHLHGDVSWHDAVPPLRLVGEDA